MQCDSQNSENSVNKRCKAKRGHIEPSNGTVPKKVSRKTRSNSKEFMQSEQNVQDYQSASNLDDFNNNAVAESVDQSQKIAL